MVAALIAGLAGCARPVAVSVPTPTDPATHSTCTALVAALPRTVGDQPVADRTPESPLTAAWGDPAIVARCGVPVPSALTPTSQLVTVNGVGWLAERAGDGYRFTTVGRAANLEVTVPGAYAPEADALVGLALVIRTEDPHVID